MSLLKKLKSVSKDYALPIVGAVAIGLSSCGNDPVDPNGDGDGGSTPTYLTPDQIMTLVVWKVQLMKMAYIVSDMLNLLYPWSKQYRNNRK